MSVLRLIVWGLIFYIVFSIVKGVSKVLKAGNANDTLKQPKQDKKSKLNIDKKDIIEAEFEEVKTTKETK